jgi:hypothetical protein
MILETGLFQADGHPGNVLVMKGGRVGLLDYGQSKQLTDADRLMVARLILALTSYDFPTSHSYYHAFISDLEPLCTPRFRHFPNPFEMFQQPLCRLLSFDG